MPYSRKWTMNELSSMTKRVTPLMCFIRELQVPDLCVCSYTLRGLGVPEMRWYKIVTTILLLLINTSPPWDILLGWGVCVWSIFQFHLGFFPMVYTSPSYYVLMGVRTIVHTIDYGPDFSTHRYEIHFVGKKKVTCPTSKTTSGRQDGDKPNSVGLIYTEICCI